MGPFMITVYLVAPQLQCVLTIYSGGFYYIENWMKGFRLFFERDVKLY